MLARVPTRLRLLVAATGLGRVKACALLQPQPPRCNHPNARHRMRSRPMSLEHLNFGPPGVRSVACQPQGFADMLFACLAYSSLSCMRAADEGVSLSNRPINWGGGLIHLMKPLPFPSALSQGRKTQCRTAQYSSSCRGKGKEDRPGNEKKFKLTCTQHIGSSRLGTRQRSDGGRRVSGVES